MVALHLSEQIFMIFKNEIIRYMMKIFVLLVSWNWMYFLFLFHFELEIHSRDKGPLIEIRNLLLLSL